MVHGCGNRMVKILFFTANLLICLFGTLIFGFSLWANLDKDFASKLETALSVNADDLTVLARYQTLLWMLIIIGAFLFFVGFLGCCGAMCENVILLTLFFIIVLALTIIEVGTVIFAAINKEQFKNVLHKLLSKVDQAEDKYLQDLKPIQDVLQCCGATQETMERYREHGLCKGELSNKPDCFTAISNYLDSTGEAIIIIAFILVFIELFALTFTCILCKAFRYERPYYYA
ncbi:Tetraspanin family protein [Acanthocheilonema viteae]